MSDTQTTPASAKPLPARSEIVRLIRAFRYSGAGLIAAFREERAIRTEIVVLVIALPFAWLIARSIGELIALVGAILAVIVVELINSAIEHLADLISPSFNLHIKRAKDYGSLAVLLTVILALSLWSYFIFRHFYP